MDDHITVEFYVYAKAKDYCNGRGQNRLSIMQEFVLSM